MCLYYPFDDTEEIHYVRCEKCSAHFKLNYGGKSQRRSCRSHKINEKGECEYCGDIHNNCFHIRKKTWGEWLFG